MNYRRLPLRQSISALIVAIALAACGGSDDPPPPTEGSATLGAVGGIVTGPDGVQLELPADALASPVTFRIARDGSGAPPLEGLNALSPVYAVTPHGQAFDASTLFSIPLSAAQVPAGAVPMLLKAEPGGNWRVMGNASGDPARLAADIHDLSFFVIGSCSSSGADLWTIGGVNCPSGHQLHIEMFDGNQRVRVLRGPNGVQLPLWYVTDTPQTRDFHVRWTRPVGTNRIDEISVRGLGSTGIRSDLPPGERNVSVNDDFSRFFRVTIDPAQVAGANSSNGKLLRIQAYASYTTTAFRIGVGNIPVGFAFETDIPILVRYSGAQPTISQQPANLGVTEGQPANFAVQASITPSAALTYQWSRRANASAAFAPINGATAASYNLATTALSDHGAEFQVQVCAAPTRCVASNPATLAVTLAPTAPGFTLQPADIGVAAGQTASFTVTATGIPLPRIEWQSAPANDPNNFTALAGTPGCTRTDPPSTGASATATCTVGPLAVGDSGRRYRAVATNSATAANSNPATVTVNPAPVAPAITQQPTAQSTTVGGSATFSVTATGTAPLNYTWQQSGTNLPSVSGGFNAGTCSGTVTYSNGNATITLSGLSAGCNGVQVNVTVSNGINPNAVSNSVVLTVNAVTQGLSLLAGAIGGAGSLDGTGDAARVQLSPENGVAFDSVGNAYFSESISGRVRRVTPAGVVTTIARATTPAGVAVDSNGNLFVAERNIGRILRITPAGVVSVWAQFLSVPTHLTIDAGDNLYVTNETGSRGAMISRISPSQAVSGFYVFDPDDYVGAIAVTRDGSVVYAVGAGGTLAYTVVSISAAGVMSPLAGSGGESGTADGTGALARFGGIAGLAIGSGGFLFATDPGNRTVRRIDPATRNVETVSGAPSSPPGPRDGEGTVVARYEYPGGIGAGPAGDLWIGDRTTLRRLQTTPTYVAFTVAGRFLRTVSGGINSALDVALDGSGNTYLAGFDRIFGVTPGGVVTTVAATPAWYLAFDRTSGDLVAANTNRVWRVTTAGVVTPLAGGGIGYVDGLGANAGFTQIGGLAVDGAGNVFVSERLSHTIRRVTPQGVVTTYAGAQDQPGSADGAASTAARFSSPSGLAFDAAGNLFVANSGNLTIRRITTPGVVSTLAGGTAPGSVDGTGLAVRFRSLSRLAFDGNGNLLIGDGSTLRRMTPAAVVSTVMGVDGESSVRLGASPRLNTVNGLAVRPNGQVVLTSEAAVLEATLP